MSNLCISRSAAFFVAAAAGLAALPPIHVPVFFEPNMGQADAKAKYLARHRQATLWLTMEGAVLGVAGKSGPAYLKLRFEGANRSPVMEAEDRGGGISNYFIGNDPTKWRTDVPQFGKVRYREIYPGIDAVFYGNPEQLEYDFVLKPGADPSRIRLVFDGASKVSRDAGGDLVIRAGGAEIRAHKPVIRQGDKFIDGEYFLRGKREARFAVGPYDRSAPLVIDPVLTYATYLGGNIGDQAYGVAVDKQGNIYVTGETSSLNFPTKNALFSSIAKAFNNPYSVFVTKINPSASGAASLVYSTLYGSNGVDQGNAIAVDSSGNVIVTGQSGSIPSDLPQMNPFQTAPTKSNTCGTAQNAATCRSGFVVKFSSSGNAMLYSSYLSGSDDDSALAITLDASGNAWIAGFTNSLDFPVRGQPYQNSLRGTQAGFLSEVNSAGSLVYSTYFAGQPSVSFNAVAADSSGNIYVAGGTNAAGIQTTPGAFQSQYPGAFAGIVAEFSPAGSLLYGTYLGASGGASNPNAIAVDSSGNIYVAGGTNAANFPVTSGGLQPTSTDLLGAAYYADGFVTKLNPSAQGSSQMVYSTFFGGSFDDVISSIAVDPAGRVTLVGSTDSIDVPTTPDAFQCCWSGIVGGGFITNYGFIARLDPSKSGSAGLVYSSLVGGTLYTNLTALALDSTGNIAAIAGLVESTNTPVTPSALQSVFGGQMTNTGYSTDLGDAYIARVDFSQTGPAITTFLNGGGLDAITSPTIAPGLVFALKGTGLGPSVYSLAQIDPSTGLIANKVQGVQVFVNGIACALTYVSSTQVNAIAPYELAGLSGQFAQVQAFYNGVAGSLITIPIAATAPGILSLDDGSGQGVIINQDGSLNGPNNPAGIGSVITIYATGEGQTNPPGIDGGIATNLNNLPHPAASVSLTIGTVPATNVTYAGTAPDEIYGLFQMNVAVPAGVSPGSVVPVVLTIGGVASQKGLTMAVK